MCNTQQADPRPGLISGLSGNVLVFGGLVVAGVSALISIGDFADTAAAIRYLLLGGVLLALAGCLLTLVSHVNSINWAKRRYYADRQTDASEKKKLEKSAESAKQWTLGSANVAIYALIGSTMTVALAIGIWVLAPGTKDRTAATVTGSDGLPLISVDGGIEKFQLRRIGDECEIEIKTSELTVRAYRKAPCGG